MSQIELGKAEKHVYTILDPNSSQHSGEAPKETTPFKLASPSPSPSYVRSQAHYHKRTISVGSPSIAAAAATHSNALSAPRSHHRRNHSAEISSCMSANREQRGVSEEKENRSPMPIWGLASTTIRFKSPSVSSTTKSSRGGEEEGTITDRMSVSAVLSPGQDVANTPSNPNRLSSTPHNKTATPTNTPKTAPTKLRSAPSSALKVVQSSSARNGGISLIPTPRRRVLDGSWKVLFDAPNTENGEPNQLVPSDDRHHITGSACSSLSNSLSSDSTISTQSGTFPPLPPDAADSATMGVAFSAKAVVDFQTKTIKGSCSPMRVSSSSHHRHSSSSGSPMVKSSPMRPANKNWCM